MLTAVLPTTLRSMLSRGTAQAVSCAGLRRFGTGQDVKAETENFVFRTSMADADYLPADPTSANPAPGVSATSSRVAEAAFQGTKPQYQPPWMRASQKNNLQPEQPKNIGGLHEADPALKTENDAKDL